MNNLLKTEDLTVRFPIKGGILQRTVAEVHAVEKVNLTVDNGEVLGLVGESGCGKSTLGRAVIRLLKPTSGKVWFRSQDLGEVNRQDLQNLRKSLQIVFQDPYESLNPRHTIGETLAEPFIIHTKLSRQERQEKIKELLHTVGLQPGSIGRFPHEFSGGQRQRISIARAISLSPDLIVCDEAVSALDVSIQSQVLNLLMELQEKLNLAYLFIAHDLAVVRHVSDRVAVMYLGKIVETASSKEIYSNPLHPYTRALIDAIPKPDLSKRKKWNLLQGDVPSPISPPSGCRFQGRCPHVKDICRQQEPPLEAPESSKTSHLTACHFTGEI